VFPSLLEFLLKKGSLERQFVAPQLQSFHFLLASRLYLASAPVPPGHPANRTQQYENKEDNEVAGSSHGSLRLTVLVNNKASINFSLAEAQARFQTLFGPHFGIGSDLSATSRLIAARSNSPPLRLRTHTAFLHINV
jgi:hypothetical protein